jgi:hypothetical protein
VTASIENSFFIVLTSLYSGIMACRFTLVQSARLPRQSNPDESSHGYGNHNGMISRRINFLKATLTSPIADCNKKYAGRMKWNARTSPKGRGRGAQSPLE